ncbi:MAG TPA: hydroxymethylbilane synthase, partial [Ferruginibacter sp.]|nr:hydroxymethylbilane synthase [Ferruginibacter sp.]
MQPAIQIGTRESELAVWQASLVKNLLAESGYSSELVFIKSDGDLDLQTPLYEMGVQGIFTRSLDIALLNRRIDIAVHSLKDVPTRLAEGIVQAAVLKRGNHKDLFVFNTNPAVANSARLRESLKQTGALSFDHFECIIATSSIRRKAQWLHRYPSHTITNLRGNINTRLQKVYEDIWQGAIFAAAGLERINLRPETSIELDWMLPAPAQGAIVVVCRSEDKYVLEATNQMNDETTAVCTSVEREFLKELLGGCATPISAFAESDKN